jgi:hypothetical protein
METEFEDELQATTPAQALTAFFGEHAERHEDVRMLGADGRAHAIEASQTTIPARSTSGSKTA